MLRCEFIMSDIATDIAEPFPGIDQGNRFILVLDYFHKWIEAYTYSNQEADTIATALVDG